MMVTTVDVTSQTLSGAPELQVTKRLEWDPSYSVGDPEIDIQHKGLFALANALDEQLSDDQLELMLRELSKYAMNHFAAEEQLMLELAYPRRSQHVGHHNTLILQLKRLSRQDFKETRNIIALRDFIHEWLREHIMKEDQGYAQFRDATMPHKPLADPAQEPELAAGPE